MQMATLTDKESFFAQLDGFDQCKDTETETESEAEQQNEPSQIESRKRSRKSDVQVGSHEKSRRTEPPSVSNRSIPREVICLPETPAGPSDLDHEIQRSERNPIQSPTRDAKANQSRKSKSRPSKQGLEESVNGHDQKKFLFEGMTFYFVPNDDVAKPRRLRIQSATSQGAAWARKLGPAVTHVIVDPDIPASAVVKILSTDFDTSKLAIVKMNWLIESLSHKSARDPAHTRFQLKGANDAFARKVVPRSPQTVKSKKILDKVSNQKDEGSGSTDALSLMINDLKSASYLPLDEEVDLNDLLSFSSGDEEVEEIQAEVKPSQVKQQRLKGFQCMESNTGNEDPNPNDRTIAILQQMATYYDRTGDNWRTLAYRKGINALRKQDKLVGTSQEARKINGIGPRLADKIEEIVTTDRLKRLDTVLSDPDEQVLQLFMGIYGAGLRQARTWMAAGYRTLEDLSDHATLTKNQKIGIEHHHDFAQRIPRAEVAQHGEIVSQALKTVDKDLQAIIGGSYRRGMPDSGDIDVMITHPTATLSQLQSWVFNIVIPHLFQIGFMKYTLAAPSSRSNNTSLPTPSPSSRKHTRSSAHLNPTTTNSSSTNPPSSSSGTKFHGASALPQSTIITTNTNTKTASPPPPWRRIDLLLVSPTSLGASLIYFTGNDIFNRSIRLLASKKGMRLNQYGLYKDVLGGKGRTKVMEGELVEGRSERRIFEILGVEYRAPEERRC